MIAEDPPSKSNSTGISNLQSVLKPVTLFAFLSFLFLSVGRFFSVFISCEDLLLLSIIVKAEWLEPLLRTPEVPSSNLGSETGYPDMFLCFSQTFQADAGIVP
jgi:hypothetical protein